MHDLVKCGFHSNSGYFSKTGPQRVGKGFTLAQNFFRCSSEVGLVRRQTVIQVMVQKATTIKNLYCQSNCGMRSQYPAAFPNFGDSRVLPIPELARAAISAQAFTRHQNQRTTITMP